MKIFFCIIKGFEKEQKKKNVELEYIRKNLTYKSIISYLSFISEPTIIYLTNEEFDEDMPFLVNYDNLKIIYIQVIAIKMKNRFFNNIYK
jgi:hypothetical protein